MMHNYRITLARVDGDAATLRVRAPSPWAAIMDVHRRLGAIGAANIVGILCEPV